MSGLASNPQQRRYRGFGVSVNLTHAKVAREKPPAKPAPIASAPEKAVTIATLPPGTLYRLISDLEALKDAFADRVEDLDVAMTEIDAAGEMTRGNCQKLLVTNDAKWSRSFGWKSLGKMLKGTGLVLALIVDDEKFEPLRAQMTRRKCHRQLKLLPPPRSPAENAGE